MIIVVFGLLILMEISRIYGLDHPMSNFPYKTVILFLGIIQYNFILNYNIIEGVMACQTRQPLNKCRSYKDSLASKNTYITIYLRKGVL